MSTIANDTLRPCPFCGSSHVYSKNRGTADKHWVTCRDCGTDGPFLDDESAAIAAWNRRAEQSDA